MEAIAYPASFTASSTAPLYGAMAASSSAARPPSWARRRPPSKIGRRSAGVTPIWRELPLNKRSSPSEFYPNINIGAFIGLNSLRALFTPWVAASTRQRAATTSGRRPSRSAPSTSGTAVGCSAASCGVTRGRAAGVGHSGLGLGQLDLAVQACRGALLRELALLFALLQRARGHVALGHQPGQRHIAAAHLGGQGVGGGCGVSLGRTRLTQGGLQLGGMLAEEVGRPAQRGLHGAAVVGVACHRGGHQPVGGVALAGGVHAQRGLRAVGRLAHLA